jgi:hypothetical protein
MKLKSFRPGCASGASGSDGIVPSVSRGVRLLTLVLIAPAGATSGWGPAAASHSHGFPGLSRATFSTPTP